MAGRIERSRTSRFPKARREEENRNIWGRETGQTTQSYRGVLPQCRQTGKAARKHLGSKTNGSGGKGTSAMGA